MEEASSQAEAARLEEQARKIVMKIWPYTTGRIKQGKWAPNKSNANLTALVKNLSPNVKRLGPPRIKTGVTLATRGKQIGYKRGLGIQNFDLLNRQRRAYQIINKAFGTTPGAFVSYPTTRNDPNAQRVAAARKAAANEARAAAKRAANAKEAENATRERKRKMLENLVRREAAAKAEKNKAAERNAKISEYTAAVTLASLDQWGTVKAKIIKNSKLAIEISTSLNLPVNPSLQSGFATP
jgi:hypothetical protein